MSSLLLLFNYFIDICDNNEIKPIITHGSLIGWYFNRKVLPWDTNINISFIGKSIDNFLNLDINKLNNNNGRFHIWINPNMKDRTPNYLKNDMIDAKIIDLNNRYNTIQITFLYQSIDNYFKENVIKNLEVVNTSTNPFKSSNYELKLKSYVKSITNNGDLIKNTNYVNCKSPHYYDIKLILPLKLEIFENRHIYVPNNVYDCLLQEYGKQVFIPKYKNWIYDNNLEIWKEIKY